MEQNYRHHRKIAQSAGDLYPSRFIFLLPLDMSRNLNHRKKSDKGEVYAEPKMAANGE